MSPQAPHGSPTSQPLWEGTSGTPTSCLSFGLPPPLSRGIDCVRVEASCSPSAWFSLQRSVNASVYSRVTNPRQTSIVLSTALRPPSLLPVQIRYPQATHYVRGMEFLKRASVIFSVEKLSRRRQCLEFSLGKNNRKRGTGASCRSSVLPRRTRCQFGGWSPGVQAL